MCKYNEVSAGQPDGKTGKGRKIYFLRQLLVCSIVWVHYFVCGLCFGAPTVLIPQLRREANSTEVVDEEMGSWLCSVFGFAAIPWVFIIPLAIRRFGRRLPYMIVCLNILVVFIALYHSSTPMQILVSEIMQGINHAANVTVSIVIVTEYTSPRYRGLFLTIKSATFFWGVWVANSIGTFLHWKYIPVCGIVCSAYCLLSLFWPESPYWLATRARYDECRRSHHWLHGDDERSTLEVENLIAAQVEYSKSCDTRRRWKFSTVMKLIICGEFYKPVLLSVLMVTQYHLSGKYVCSMYAIDIIKKITKNEGTAYTGMLILDGVTVLGMYVGCSLSKVLRRRILYLGSSAIGIMSLFIIALYLYLDKLSILEEQKIVSIALLIAFSVPISCGPMIMSTSIYGEIIPSRFKTAAFLITALVSEVLSTTFLKIAPLIFRKLGIHGAFMFYGIACGLCTILLYVFLPETKDKTLQEIEEYFKNKEEKPKEQDCITPLQKSS